MVGITAGWCLLRREKRKQREAIERIKLGVQTQEELERQNEIPDVNKKQPNGKHSVYTDEGDAASSVWHMTLASTSLAFRLKTL